MTIAAVNIARLSKAATDNGFDLGLGRENDWLVFGSSQTKMRIWLSATVEPRFVAAASRTDVLSALDGHGEAWSSTLPAAAVGAYRLVDIASLHRLLRRAFQLARTLPHALLDAFNQQTANLPRTTEAERLVVQRVGQDIFRRGLLEFWDGRCAITGLDVPELLRASHIKPWADCATDGERLDVFNGLLLAPHVDALFDTGLITIAESGSVLCSTSLPPDTYSTLGLDGWLKVDGLDSMHEDYLPWHRAKVFRGANVTATE
ncbi:MAG: HNH endonuclease [Gammaproteobacteria bacterium]|nr:HNH endonuclease [Gammaproteobacteria bacterium]